MRSTNFALLTILLPATAVAQSTVIPSHLASVEGGRNNLTFAAYANQRVQWAEGELGSSPRSIKGIGLRLDSVAAVYGTTARSYANVEIHCSDCDHSVMSTTFANNPKSTPTSVFSGALSLPGLPGNNWVRPQPWHPSLNMAFQTVYQHTGAKDLLLDFKMTGGKLANGAAWSGTRSRFYNIDSPYVSSEQVVGLVTYYGDGEYRAQNRLTSTGCKDSRVRIPSGGPVAWLAVARYQPTHSQPAFRNMTNIAGVAYNVPGLTNIAFIYGAPNPGGVTFPGVACNKVYVDMAAAPIVRFAQSGFSSSPTFGARAFDYLLGTATATIPSNSSWEGIEIMTQAAFLDSGTGELRISQAGSTAYPELPPSSLRRVTVWQWDANSSTGRPSSSSADFPVIRYSL